MGLFSWFKKPTRPEDYEGVLARVASEINDAKLHLSEVRLRERRYSLLLNAYGVGLWAIWLGLWWWGAIPWGLVGWNEWSTEARVLGTAGVIAGPIMIILSNQLIRFIFKKIRTSEETHLRLLLAKQRKQVDEIKKATNYDSTRKLLEQYDAMNSPQGQGQLQRQQAQPQSSSPSTPNRNPNSPVSPRVPGTPGAPQSPSPVSPGGVSPSTPVPLPPGMTQEQAALFAMQLQAIQPILPTPEKKWYDRLADSILGDDPAQAANSKYALVCGECFRHNGLVGNKHEWERMQWICPRCDHLNPPPLSRMQLDMPEPETPTKPKKVSPTTKSSPVVAPHMRAPAPRRRERGAAPRQSRLGTEVFSAADQDGGEQDEEMEVDK